MYIKSIAKDYGEYSKITVYKKGVNIDPPMCKIHLLPSCQICWTRKTNTIPKPSSLMRTKTRITDYTLANEFDLFCTFTFDPQKVDSFDFEKVKQKLKNYLDVQRRKSPFFKYLIVAELHKSGRVHFHALFKNYQGDLIIAYHPKTNKPLTKNNRQLYNIPDYKWGNSTAVKIDNIEKVSSYIQKYITKDMLKITNKKRYLASKNLIKPQKTYNVPLKEIVYSRPLFIQGVHQEEYYKIYKVLNIHSPLFGEAVVAETGNKVRNVFEH